MKQRSILNKTIISINNRISVQQITLTSKTEKTWQDVLRFSSNNFEAYLQPKSCTFWSLPKKFVYQSCGK